MLGAVVLFTTHNRMSLLSLQTVFCVVLGMMIFCVNLLRMLVICALLTPLAAACQLPLTIIQRAVSYHTVLSRCLESTLVERSCVLHSKLCHGPFSPPLSKVTAYHKKGHQPLPLLGSSLKEQCRGTHESCAHVTETRLPAMSCHVRSIRREAFPSCHLSRSSQRLGRLQVRLETEASD